MHAQSVRTFIIHAYSELYHKKLRVLRVQTLSKGKILDYYRGNVYNDINGSKINEE